MERPSYQTTRLPDGPLIASLSMPWMRSVSFGLWVGVGSRHETPATNGVSHFLEHMLFKGTKKRTAREITLEVESVGGDINAFTSEDHTCFHVKVPTRQLERAADVLLDMVAHSRCEKAELEREREVICEEILMAMDQPSHRAQEGVTALLWKGHALGFPITGTVDSVRGIKHDTLLNHWRTHYRPDQLVFTAAGALSHEELVEIVRKRLAKSQKATPFTAQPWRERSAKPRVMVAYEDTEQAHVEIGFRTVDRHDPKRYALKILSVILGETMSSRLFQELREERGWCYNVQTGASAFSDTGSFGIGMALDVKRLSPALKVVKRELDRLRTRKLTRRELDEAKEYCFGQNVLGLESTNSQMHWMGESILAYGRVYLPQEAEQGVAETTADDVREAARTFFIPEKMACAVVGPTKEEAPVRTWMN